METAAEHLSAVRQGIKASMKSAIPFIRREKKSTADAPMKNNMRQARMVLKTISEEQKKWKRKSWSDMKRPH